MSDYDPWRERPTVTPEPELPKLRTKFRKGKPYRFRYVTGRGDSGVCFDEEDVAETVKLYTERMECEIAIFELKSIHKPKKRSRNPQ